MSGFKKLFKNIIFVFWGQSGSKMLVYLLLPLYTSVLTTEEYGTVDFISITISLLVPLLTIDIAEACFRFAMDKDADKRQVFSIGFHICIAVALCTLALYPLLSLIPVIRDYYVYFAVSLISNAFNAFLMQFVKGCQKIKLYSACGVVHTVILLGSNLLFLLVFKWGLNGYLLASVVAELVTNLLLLLRIPFWKLLIPFNEIDKNVFKQLAKYSIPMMPNSACWWISNSSDKYMLSVIRNVSEQGIYSIAYKIPSAMSVVIAIFMNAWSVSAVEAYDSAESKRFFGTIYNAFFGCVLIVCSALILSAELLARILYQKNFFIAWQCSLILLVAFAFNSVSVFLGTVYVAAKRTEFLFISTMAAAVINVLLNLLLIPRWGMYGAAVATFASYFVVWLVRLINTKKILDFSTDNFRHMASCFLLVVQIVLLLMDVSISYIVAGIAFVLTILINASNVLKLVKIECQSG